MIAKWGICVVLFGLLAISAGCRTPQPNLKPDTTAERLVEPPAGAYATSTLPRQAFDKPADPYVRDDGKNPGVMPTRGGMGSGGMPGR